MTEYSNDIKEQKIIHECGDYVVCHPFSFPKIIHVYHLCTYKPALSKISKTSWLSCGTWYQKDDGRYYDSNNPYGCGLGVADTVMQIVDKIKHRNSEKEETS